MKHVRLGIVGVGNMGSSHARNLLAGQAPRVELAAICDPDPARTAAFPRVRCFATAEEMIRSGAVDAVLVATPHYDHVPTATAALRAGLHVLIEKPIAVHKREAERLLAEHREHPRLACGVVFNQRTDAYYQRIRALIESGELGAIRRVNWVITNWFRTDAYYASSPWRATWAGEGGGLLLNQCPHNLDLWQWLFGMPARVRAFCGFGRYHDVEVEDDVTAYLEFPDGATGVFIGSTGEAPGANRLEIAAENGRVVYEDDRIIFTRNAAPMSEFSRTASGGFARPATESRTLPAEGHGGQHVAILQNFADAVLDGAPLIAPVEEGVHSVELANAMLLSAWTGDTVELPMSGQRYERLLHERIAASRASNGRAQPANGAHQARELARSVRA